MQEELTSGYDDIITNNVKTIAFMVNHVITSSFNLISN